MIRIAFLLFLSLATLMSYQYKTNKPILGFGIKKIENHKVSLIEVLSGNEFNITVENGKKIHLFLSVKTVPEAKDQVLKFINEVTAPRVVLLKQLSDGWLGDIIVDNDVSLTEWLKTNNLIWQ